MSSLIDNIQKRFLLRGKLTHIKEGLSIFEIKKKQKMGADPANKML